MPREIEVKATGVFLKNMEATAKTVVNFGSARSSKSHSIAQGLIMRANNYPGRRIGITRKTLPSLKRTAYRLVQDLLIAYERYSPDLHNKTDLCFELSNSSRFEFFGLDNPERIKSAEFHEIWMEEANEFTWGDYLTLLTRLSAKEPP